MTSYNGLSVIPSFRLYSIRINPPGASKSYSPIKAIVSFTKFFVIRRVRKDIIKFASLQPRQGFGRVKGATLRRSLQSRKGLHSGG